VTQYSAWAFTHFGKHSLRQCEKEVVYSLPSFGAGVHARPFVSDHLAVISVIYLPFVPQVRLVEGNYDWYRA
jgi:hypothetical protein